MTQLTEKQRENTRASHKKWVANNLELARELKYEYRRKNPEKNRAQVYAIRNVPLKDYCELCGEKGVKLTRHHPDYSKPLEVQTLCLLCHKKADQIRDSSNPSSEEDRHCVTCGKTFGRCERKRISVKGRSCTFWVPKDEHGERKE